MRASRRREGGGARARGRTRRRPPRHATTNHCGTMNRHGPGPDSNSAAYRSATARAPSRSPARSRRASSPCRHPDSATRPSACSASSAWVNLGTAFVPARFARDTSRHRLLQPVASRASSTRCGPRPDSPIPRWSSLRTSRWPGSRARSGRGRAGRPSRTEGASGTTGARRPGFHARLAGTTIPPGSASAASTSSISIPMTGCNPAASAAAENRTAPYRPWWSVIASPARPSSTARATRSSGADAPSRNEKWLWQWSSAYGGWATTAVSGGGQE